MTCSSLLLIFLGLLPITSPRVEAREWKLIWSDEFDSDGAPDPKKWSYDLGGHGWGNKELQFYTDQRANSRLGEGRLIIEARKETMGRNSYTSARLITKGKAHWAAGRIEVRAKLPAGRGCWPAIWLLPATEKRRWPDEGEIDVMEHVGFDPGVVHATIHTKKYNHLIGTHKAGTTTVADCTSTFHRYSVEWSRDRMDFFVDDTKYFTYEREPGAGPDTWPFDKDFYLILNLAVGGNWGGQKGIDDSAFPARMEVDYVRVYEQVAKQ